MLLVGTDLFLATEEVDVFEYQITYFEIGLNFVLLKFFSQLINILYYIILYYIILYYIILESQFLNNIFNRILHI